ncbi:hypothetical protein SAMN04487983_100367 [Streptomyces sp. yr375]|uniref:hypothetical protein n=1 Tax=Streptomyces sp. yr375 TaxID=1761906 RepID=UPI0008B1A44D|nr:hypothetical protein [Streptomyces sp. yr375]SEQ10176.1 hypothetical protein SAMN04487983_100367 [Streptomyces sp. yr375]
MSRTRSRVARSTTFLLAAGLAMTTLAATAPTAQAASSVAGPITRAEIISRAQNWVDEAVPYNQGTSYPDPQGRNYRMDCSGYVSMAWHADQSYTTWTLPNVSTEVSKSSLLPGDALNYSEEHVILFGNWIDKSAGTFKYFAEQNSTVVTNTYTGNLNSSSLAGWPTSVYKGLRYDKTTSGQDGIGMWDTYNRYFHLRNSPNAGANDRDFVYGGAGMTPLTGNWDGQGADGVGMWDPTNHTFYLRNSPNAGGNDYEVSFGSIGDIPVVGDWDGNGTDTIGVWRPSNHTFYLRNSNTPGAADKTFAYGGDGMIPLAGDWDGIGTDGIGMYDPATHMVYLRNSPNAGGNDFQFGYGTTGDKPVVGDYDGDGKDTVAIWRPSNHNFYINNQNTNNDADYNFAYGGDDMIPLAGDWDGQ